MSAVERFAQEAIVDYRTGMEIARENLKLGGDIERAKAAAMMAQAAATALAIPAGPLR